MYAGQYNQDANRAMQWAGMAPEINNMRYADASKLIDVGAAQRGEAQTELQSYIDKWTAQRDAGVNAVEWANGIAGGMGRSGGSSSGSSASAVPQGSRISGLLGGALTGAGATGSPWGAALGGMAGLFS
ncbi:MAG: hypothetical protein H0U63_01525 [Burkholderiales bacterium]|nr:hypothetical protein [Burkholderiales bacterium]